MDFLPFLLSILFFPIGFFFGGYVYKLKSKALSGNSHEKIAGLEARLLQSETLLKKTEEAKQVLQSEKEFLGIDQARMQVNLKHLEEKNKEQNEAFSKLQEKFTKEFENLAHKILDEKSQKFTHQNKENITNILLPLQEKINYLRKKYPILKKKIFIFTPH
jgi:DNA recombination protein RmuC